MTTLDACAAAIAGVRSRYYHDRNYDPERLWDRQESKYITFANHMDCQNFLDREAARACLLATLPVDDEVEGVMADSLRNAFIGGGVRAVVSSISNAFTAAVRHIVGEREGV